MEFIVSMVRDSAEAGGRDLFSCSFLEWERMIELGKTFGWKPKGAVYLPAKGSGRAGASARHDYRPGDAQDYKQVETDDAFAWATALSEARRSPHLAAMLSARSGLVVSSGGPADDGGPADEQVSSAMTPSLAILDEFIEYAFGGAFAFARS